MGTNIPVYRNQSYPMVKYLQQIANSFKMATQTQMKPPPIRSLQANPVQITADQLLQDASIHQTTGIRPPDQHLMNQKEMNDYKQEKRREFENKIRRQRYNISAWIRYAQWEESAKEFIRARSIFERALEVEYTNKGLWLRYVQMEMRHKFINHARNIWERAVYYLPREDQFWFKYAYMQELLGEYQKGREVFERWMDWIPAEKAWMSYVKFEQRMGEHGNVKKVMYRYLQVHPSLESYLKVIRLQIKGRHRDGARSLLERTITDLGAQAMCEDYFLEFSKFQIKHRQYQRARQIFKFGLKEIPKDKCKKLYSEYLNFEKEHGTKQQIDEVILGERRGIYKQLLAQNQLNYDSWINLVTLEQSTGNFAKTREVYQAAIKCIPPSEEKRFWRRYIYLWYNYAVFQEDVSKDLHKANQIYERAIKIVPHKKFTFSHLWINYAHFNLRCNDLQKARKTLGRSIGMCPRQKVIKAYIQLEEQLCELDRVRQLYEKLIDSFPDTNNWVRYATFQRSMEEFARAKQILQIGVTMGVLGLPDTDKFIEEAQQQE